METPEYSMQDSLDLCRKRFVVRGAGRDSRRRCYVSPSKQFACTEDGVSGCFGCRAGGMSEGPCTLEGSQYEPEKKSAALCHFLLGSFLSYGY